MLSPHAYHRLVEASLVSCVRYARRGLRGRYARRAYRASRCQPLVRLGSFLATLHSPACAHTMHVCKAGTCCYHLACTCALVCHVGYSCGCSVSVQVSSWSIVSCQPGPCMAVTSPHTSLSIKLKLTKVGPRSFEYAFVHMVRVKLLHSRYTLSSLGTKTSNPSHCPSLNLLTLYMS